jgi:hypothetical protein
LTRRQTAQANRARPARSRTRLAAASVHRQSTLVIPFPVRAIHTIVVCRERNGDGWITLAGAHGWLFGSLADAQSTARWLSHNLGLPIREYSS